MKETEAKVSAIHDMMQHPGWKVVEEAVETLIAHELMALRGIKLDENYYKKIGFIQMYKFCKDLPVALENEEARYFLIHQGREIAAEYFLNPMKLVKAAHDKARAEFQKPMNEEERKQYEAEQVNLQRIFNQSQLK